MQPVSLRQPTCTLEVLQAQRLRTANAVRLRLGAVRTWHRSDEREFLDYLDLDGMGQPASWRPARRETDSGRRPPPPFARVQARRYGSRGAGPAPDRRPDALHHRRQLLRPARRVRARRPLLPGCAPAAPRLRPCLPQDAPPLLPGCIPALARVRLGSSRGAPRHGMRWGAARAGPA